MDSHNSPAAEMANGNGKADGVPRAQPYQSEREPEVVPESPPIVRNSYTCEDMPYFDDVVAISMPKAMIALALFLGIRQFATLFWSPRPKRWLRSREVSSWVVHSNEKESKPDRT